MMPAVQGAPSEVVRVMVVDDSAVIRGLVTRWLGAEPGFAVVASCRTGRAAVDDIVRFQPHVVTLDIEMPDMDGLTALPLLLKAKPDAAIVMASTLTRRNADVSLRCLALGAADFITKPTSDVAQADYRREFVAKVRALGDTVMRRARPAASGSGPRAAFEILRSASAGRFAAKPVAAAAAALRPFARNSVRAIAIGASTGGPQALATVVNALRPVIAQVPILVTQHMPATFTAALAEHLGIAGACPAREAAHGEPLLPGTIYVAPGGRHFTIVLNAGKPCASIGDWAPENFCKPSVDPMFRGAAAAYGAGLLAVMLTGMGADGAGGVRAVSAAGGSIIAQDEATSVVWGMPAAAAATGCCSAILPLPAIGPKIIRLIAGDRA